MRVPPDSRGKMSQPRVSVVIPVKNEADKIGRCLEAVLSQSLQPFEVIVVDGHSTDGTVEEVKKFPVKLLYEEYHTRGGARQVGVDSAQGEYVAFSDASCIPDKEWLSSLAGEFGEDIVGVGGQTTNIGDTFWTRSVNLAFATPVGSANSIQGRQFREKRLVSSLSGCNSMYRKQSVLQVGGFNVNWVSEDSELNARLLKVGKLLYTPRAVVLHKQDRTLREFCRQMYRWGRVRIHTPRFEPQLVPPILVPPLFLSLIATRWVLLGALGLYLLIIGSLGASFAIRERNIRYLFSIPVVFVAEHSCYTAGFWRELIGPRRKAG
jgi:cellulose synthase/poly-beta-1,6-N-acetylglucosamine synthase-like glycosyltransferase